MASCNHADVTAERSFRSPMHALISPRFLKSQPAPGHSTSITELDQRLVRSQPASQSGSPRCVQLYLVWNDACISLFYCFYFPDLLTVTVSVIILNLFISCCRSFGNIGPSTFHLKQIDYQRNVLPPGLRSPTPMELFLCRSQTAGAHKAPGTCNTGMYSCR